MCLGGSVFGGVVRSGRGWLGGSFGSRLRGSIAGRVVQALETLLLGLS